MSAIKCGNDYNYKKYGNKIPHANSENLFIPKQGERQIISAIKLSSRFLMSILFLIFAKQPLMIFQLQKAGVELGLIAG